MNNFDNVKNQKQCYKCGTTFSFGELDILKSLVSEKEIVRSVICPVCKTPIKIK